MEMKGGTSLCTYLGKDSWVVLQSQPSALVRIGTYTHTSARRPFSHGFFGKPGVFKFVFLHGGVSTTFSTRKCRQGDITKPAPKEGHSEVNDCEIALPAVKAAKTTHALSKHFHLIAPWGSGARAFALPARIWKFFPKGYTVPSLSYCFIVISSIVRAYA